MSVRKMGRTSEIADKILELFYDNPSKRFTLREITSLTKIPKSTVHDYLKNLKKDNLISKDNYSLNSYLFKVKKINFYIEKIISSGLLEHLIEEFRPDCLILFGSFRKGESDSDSDIDIFVEAPLKKELSLNKYEKKLKHKVHLFVEEDIHNLQPRLFNNVVNGIKLYGSFKIK